MVFAYKFRVYKYNHGKKNIFVNLVKSALNLAIRGTFLTYLVQYTQKISLVDIGGITSSRTTVSLLRPDTPDTVSIRNFWELRCKW